MTVWFRSLLSICGEFLSFAKQSQERVKLSALVTLLGGKRQATALWFSGWLLPLFLWDASIFAACQHTWEVKIVLPVYISLNSRKLNFICQCVARSHNMFQDNWSVSDFIALITWNNLRLLENLASSMSISLLCYAEVQETMDLKTRLWLVQRPRQQAVMGKE